MGRLTVVVLPPAPFFGRILVRSGIAWGAMRGFVGFTPVRAHLAVSASLLLIAIAAWLALFFGRLRYEDLFLANLGVRGSVVAGCAVVVPVLGELAIRLVT